MKVLHIIPSVATIRGGPSQAIYEMAASLKEHQNLEVEIVTTNDNGDSLLDVPLNKRINYKGVPTRFFARFSPQNSSIREFTMSISLTKWLWENISHYDVLHVHAIFSYPSTAAMTIAELKKIPYLVRPGGHLCRWALQQGASKKRAYLKLIALRNINCSIGIHFTTVQEYDEAKELEISAPKFILPHGISCPSPVKNARLHLRQMLAVPENEPVILFMSRLHPKKGLEHLLSALAELTTKRFSLVIAGTGAPDYESHLKALIEKHGLLSRTHLLGFVKGEKKNMLLHGSDLFALTSYSENFGVAVLEALAVGLPALTTSGVALSETISKHDLGYVTDMDISSIKSALSNFLENPDLAKDKGNRAKKIVKSLYSWDTVTKRLVEFYEAAQVA